MHCILCHNQSAFQLLYMHEIPVVLNASYQTEASDDQWKTLITNESSQPHNSGPTLW
jgi:hypothetical protein